MNSRPIKFRLTIAYDGTRYAGWQVQKTGLGVQQVIEEAVTKLFPHASCLHSSSRTDTGVHALGMVAHLEIPKAEFKMPEAKLILALNAHLRQHQVPRVTPDFRVRQFCPTRSVHVSFRKCRRAIVGWPELRH